MFRLSSEQRLFVLSNKSAQVLVPFLQPLHRLSLFQSPWGRGSELEEFDTAFSTFIQPIWPSHTVLNLDNMSQSSQRYSEYLADNLIFSCQSCTFCEKDFSRVVYLKM